MLHQSMDCDQQGSHMPYTPTKIWKLADPGAPLNREEKLKKIIEASQGLVSKATLSIDRIVISSKFGYWVFYNKIQKSFNEIFGPYRPYKVNDDDKEDKKGRHLVYEYWFGKSRILLRKSYYSITEPDKNWDYIILLDPTLELQNIIKKILKPLIRKKSRIRFISEADDPHIRVISLSTVETALDFHLTKVEENSEFTELMNHYTVLAYCGLNSYGECEDTGYRGKNKYPSEGSKGTRTYPKAEYGEVFSRNELQSNRGHLRYNELNIDSLPISPYSIDIFKSIGFRHGLNEVSFETFVSAITKSYIKSTKDDPLAVKDQKTLQQIFRSMVLSDLGITSPSELESIPVQKQIDIFKRYVLVSGGKHQVSYHFPRIDSWEELFEIILEKLTLLQEHAGLGVPVQKGGTHVDNVDLPSNSTDNTNPRVQEKSPRMVALYTRPVVESHQEHEVIPVLQSAVLASKTSDDRHCITTRHDMSLSQGKAYTGTCVSPCSADGLIEVVNVDHPSKKSDNCFPTVISKNAEKQFPQSTVEALPPREWRELGWKLLRKWKNDLRRSGSSWDVLKKFGIEEMVDVCELGWNRSLPPCSSRHWGLPPERFGVIRIPEGLVVPHFLDSEIVHLSIFSPDYINGNYIRSIVQGGTEGSCLTFKGIECSRTLIVMNELDAIYCKQHAWDLVNVVALGDSDVFPNASVHKLLDKSSRILVVLDGTLPLWLTEEYGERLRIMPYNPNLPLCQSFKNKDDLRSWILSDLTRSDPQRYIRNHISSVFVDTNLKTARSYE